MLPGRARLFVLSKLLHPTASQPISKSARLAAIAATGRPKKGKKFANPRLRATRANDGHTMSTAGVPSRPQSSALQLSGLRTLATTWSKLPSRLSLHSLHARMP